MIVNEKNKDSCATLIQNFTSYPATLTRGIIGYIEIPITQTTPPHYRVNDVNSLIHSVIHAYHPDTTTPIKPTPYADMNLCTRVTPQSLLEINKIEVNDKTLQLPIPSNYCRQQVPFFDPSFFKYKKNLLISSYQKIDK